MDCFSLPVERKLTERGCHEEWERKSMYEAEGEAREEEREEERESC